MKYLVSKESKTYQGHEIDEVRKLPVGTLVDVMCQYPCDMDCCGNYQMAGSSCTAVVVEEGLLRVSGGWTIDQGMSWQSLKYKFAHDSTFKITTMTNYK